MLNVRPVATLHVRAVRAMWARPQWRAVVGAGVLCLLALPLVGLARVLHDAGRPGSERVLAASTVDDNSPTAPSGLHLQGGPDAFGYTFRDNISDGTIGYAFIDISDPMTGTRLALTTEEDLIPVPLPFPVRYYGSTYNQLFVSENGFASFGSVASSFRLPSTSACQAGAFNHSQIADNVLLAFWDDFEAEAVPPGDSGVWYGVVGSAPNRAFVIQWHEMPFFTGSTERVTFQIRIEEGSSNVRFLYDDLGDPMDTRARGGNALVGIVGANPPGDALEYGQCETARLQEMLHVFFQPPNIDNEITLDCGIPGAAADEAIAGRPWTCGVTVVNDGPTVSRDTIVTATLPISVEYRADTDTCTLLPGAGPGGRDQLSCDLGSIEPPGDPSGNEVQFDIAMLVHTDAVAGVADGVDTLTLDAVVGADGVELAPGDNTTSETDILRDEADLTVTKVSKPDTDLRAGEQFTYTVFVENLGPSYARGVELVDDVLSDAGFVLVAVDNDPGRPDSCTLTGTGTERRIRCELDQALEPVGDFRSSGSGRWTIRVRVQANNDQDINNLVRVFTDDDLAEGWVDGTPDPDTSNNEAAVFLSQQGVADLRVTKGAVDPMTGSPITVITAGQRVGYVITVVNGGPSAAEAVTVRDALPRGLVDGSVSVNRLGCTLGTPGDPIDPLTCGLGTLDAGQAVSFTLSADVNPDYVAAQPDTALANALENDVRVTSDTLDDDASNNRQNLRTAVSAVSDLQLDKEAIGVPVAGQPLSYRYTIRAGPSTAQSTVLTDTLPAGVTFQEAYLSLPGQSGGVPVPCTLIVGSNTLSCALGDLPRTGTSGPATLIVNVGVDADVPDGASLVNSALVSSVTFDNDATNNSASTTSTVAAQADLAVEKTVDERTPNAGDQIVYTVRVTNNGPSLAPNVLVTDTLPAGVSYVIDTLGCGPTLAGCMLGDLAPKASRTFDIVGRVAPETACGAELTNTAVASSDVADPVAANDSDAAFVDVACAADLRILKFGKPDGEVRAGERLTYTLIVDNLGPSYAHSVTITDELVSSGAFTLVGLDPDVNGNRPSASCSPAAPATSTEGRLTVTCSLVDALEVFGPGAGTGRWVVELVVSADETQDINNSAAVSSTDADSNADNNTAFVEHDITDVSDLSVTKQAVGEVQVAGQPGDVFNINNESLPPLQQQPFPAGPSYTTSPTNVTAGRRISYTLTVANDGPSTAENVVVSDRLPPGVTIVPGTLDVSSGSCQTGTPGEPLDRMTCGLGSMSPGAVRTVTFHVLVDTSLAPGSMLENDVSVTADTFDDDNRDNFDSTQTVVNTWADMSITKLSVGETVTDCDDDLGRHEIEALPGQVTAGRELRYEITVQNNGASDAQNVQILDLLPGQSDTGLDHDPVTFLHADGAYCRPADELQEIGVFGPGAEQGKFGQVLWCSLGTVPAGARRTFDIHVAVDPAVPDGGTITNGAYVWWGASSPPADPGAFLGFPFPQIPPELPTTDDPMLDDNFADTDTDVSTVADVAVEKTSEPVKVNAGMQKKYTLWVTNTGPSVARDVVLTDTLPPEVRYEIDTLGGACTVAAGPPDVVTCDLGDLNPGQEVHFEIFARVDPSVAAGTEITNTAVVTTSTTDFCQGNNTATSDNLVLREADLRLTKFGKPDGEVRAGELLTYTLIVDNLGPSYAHGVVVTDVLVSSGEFTLVSVNPNIEGDDGPATCSPTSGGSTAGRLTVVCQLNEDLGVYAPPDGDGRWIIEIVVSADETQDINNAARVTTAASDPDGENNYAFVEHDILDVSDMSVEKTAMGQVVVDGCPPTIQMMPDMVTAGLDVTYTIVVTNGGPSTAENSVLVDRLPPGITVTSVTTSQGSCSTGTPGSAADRFTCGLGTLAPGASATVTVVATVNSNLADGTVLENDAHASSVNIEPDNANNHATNLTTVKTSADLSVVKTDEPDPVVAGEMIEYTVTVNNDGPSRARRVVVTDTLPADVSFKEIRDPFATGVSCSLNTIDERTLTCALGDMPAGSERTFVIVGLVDPNAAAMLDNEVTVASNTSDPCLDDNTFNEGTNVDREDQVFVRKTDDPDPVLAGTELAWTITFGNNGPSTATSVVVTDTLPLGTLFQRCESLDPNDQVSCQVLSGDGITTRQVIRLQQILDGNNVAYQQGSPPDDELDPGERYRYRMIADVVSGYVLDDFGETGPGEACRSFFLATDYPYFAHNRVDITSDQDTDRDDECTRVNAEADVSIELTDLVAEAAPLLSSAFGIGDARTTADLPGPVSVETTVRQPVPFMTCDPVGPGTMLTYEALVTNHGPSDARGVVAIIQLPEAGVALDPAQVEVEVSAGQVLEVRDDGRVTVAVGDGPNTFGGGEIGRLNAGQAETITMRLMVLESACADGMALEIEAEAEVMTLPTFEAPLDGASEVPPVATGASGTATAFLLPDTRELFFVLDVQSIDGITQAHIHRGAAGTNGPIIHWLYDANGVEAPDGPFGPGQPVAGSVFLSAADVADLRAGGLYVNVHTTDVPSGEIRGQLMADAETPTADPDLTNNTDVEMTTIECPGIEVVKTVSRNGQCPGASTPVVAQFGEAVTYCLAITNTGTTYLDTIRVTDTVQTRLGATIVFTDVITFGADAKLPVAPGETVERQYTVDPLAGAECGVSNNQVEVTATAVNSGRTVMPCVPVAPATDSATVYVPCGGVDVRLGLPALNTDDCQAQVQVQNVGEEPTATALVVWGEPGFCPPQAAGPLKVECSGILRPGSTWTFAAGQLPPGAHSAVAYSLSAEPVPDEELVPFFALVCDEVFFGTVGDYLEWQRFDSAYRNGLVYEGFDFGRYQGQPLAVTVNRQCPDPTDPNVPVNAAYAGVSSDNTGLYDPEFGGYAYYTPLVFADQGGLNSWLYLQNLGIACSSIEIWFKAQDNCLRPILGDVMTLTPGESVHFDPNTAVGPGWLGSAWIRSSQPLAAVVDSMGPNHLTTYSARPADVFDAGFSLGTEVNFAPLIYSEQQGWDSAIQVQNLSSTTAAKAKVYFLDRSGDIITTLVDWICPRGSQTFFLPVINNIPGNWVGSARVESQEWWSPGDPVVTPPNIHSVVLLEKWSDPARTERQEAVAYNGLTECLAFDWQLGQKIASPVLAVPFLAKEWNGFTTELAITNLVPKPGFTDFVVYVYDQNGLIDHFCEKLNEKQVEYIDLARWGFLPPRFNGSAVISAVFWEHDVFDPQGGFERNIVGLGAVIVERVGTTQDRGDIPGDESKAHEAAPIFDVFLNERAPNCPGVPGLSQQ